MARENKPQQDPLTGNWAHHVTEVVLEEVGLNSIAHYVEVQRQTIVRFIVDRLIFSFCSEAERWRGTAPCQWWWEQSMELDLESGEGEE